ncbi:cytokine receptor-like [Culicoides brevitarsis]|uniref:cytokine receptor-like n=1 Tax=Culicoides brevitarsis TaxID=469753 RepID=UPI00307B607E
MASFSSQFQFYHTRQQIHRILLTVIFSAIFFSQGSCSRLWTGTGVVIPETVNALVGSSVDVICTLNLTREDGRNSSYLYFGHNGKRIPQKEITILNSSSILWHVDRAELNHTKRYKCLLQTPNGTEGVGIVNVYVDYKPDNVTDFKCHSYNWQNLTCSFTRPQTNFPIKYELWYFTNLLKYYKNPCVLKSVENTMIQMCEISNAQYRKTHNYFNFTLQMISELFNETQHFNVMNFETIVPAPPENIVPKFVTSRNATIFWTLSDQLNTLPKGYNVNFVHDVRILSEFDNKGDNNDTVWRVIDPKRVQQEKRNDQNLGYFVVLDDLPYANAWYDVRIRVRTDRSSDTEDMYSAVGTTPVHTEARIPDRPPKMDEGAFFINDDNDIYIFWEELLKSERNGPNASYVVTEVRENDRQVSRVPVETKNTFAKFSKTDMYAEYKFVVRSQNSLGKSTHGSLIRIPPKADRLRHPLNLKKISQDGVYNLSWEDPYKGTQDVSYTVFWCKPLNSLPNACDGEFHFARVDQSVNNFTLEQNGSINFAVSTNNGKSSSGMVWAMCTAAQSSDIGKIKTIWITQIGSSHMELKWKLDCMYDSIVKGYEIKFCPIRDPVTLECKEKSQKNITINQTANNYTLTGLKPYTTYKIVLSMFSDTRHGPDSDPLQNTTLEARPTPPIEFKAYDVRNTSMKLEWKRPRDSNGVLMYYSIFYNGNHIEVYNVTNDTTKEPYEKMTYLLQNLTSFTNYELLVKACNQFCSENSNKDNKTTAIGIPGSMGQASSTTHSNNANEIEVSWTPPKVKSGHINFYELRSVSKYRGKIVDEKIVRIESKHLSCRRPSPCVPNIDTIEFSVRAVNIIRSPHAPDDNSMTTQVTQKYRDTTHNNRIDTDDEMAVHSTKHPLRHFSGHHQSCEVEDKAYINWLDSDMYPEYLKGEWSKAIVTNCMHYGGIDAKTIVTMICSLVLMCTMLGVGYKFYQKIKHMKNILIVLPAELQDIQEEKRPDNFDGGNGAKKLAKPDIIMDNLGSVYEEEDRLLRKRTDTDSSAQNNSEESNSTAEAHDDCLEDQSYDVMGLIDDGSQSSNHSMSMDNDFEPNQQPSYTSQFIPGNPTSTPTQAPTMPYPVIMSNGYCKPSSMLQPNASGYVQHTAMTSARPAPPTNPASYIPYNPVGRPVTSLAPENTADINNSKMGMKTPIVASTDANGISGYVTHKQLSDFGHRMQ